MYDRQISISVGNSRNSKSWRQENTTVSALYTRLSQPIVSTETHAEYMNMPKSQQDDLKDVGGFVGGTLNGTRRKAANVTGRDIITLDFDNIPGWQADTVTAKVEALRCGYCIYSTRKHTPAKPRLRIIIPLDRTATPDEYEPIARRIAQQIGIERKYLAHYIDEAFGGKSYVWLGDDLEEYDDELNPDVEVETNILGEQNVKHNGYDTEGDVDPYYAEYGSPLFVKLSAIANGRKKGEICHTTKVDVLLREDMTVVWAYREDISVIPDSIGGDTSGVQIPFSIYSRGNRVKGSFDISTKMFEPTNTVYAVGGVILIENNTAFADRVIV